jgi:hypothetical protein
MDVWGTVEGWAKNVWQGVQNLGGAAESVFEALWRFIQSVYAATGWLLSALLSPGILIITAELKALFSLHQELRDALDRVAWWIDTYMIDPLRSYLLGQIFALEILTMAKFAYLTNLMEILHLVEERHTDDMVAQEAQTRAKAVASARAYAQALTGQLHQAIENEAVAGYKAGQGIRTTLLGQLADDLNVRGLLDTVTTRLLVDAIDAVMTIDDPALAAVANRIINTIIKKTGLGDALADLISRLIGAGPGGAAPKNLTGVIADITHRLGVIEDWISQFMLDGGPEIEAVGKQLKMINSLVVDAALLGFIVQAVTSPNAWATEVSDTVGTLANDTIGRIIGLIGHV